MEANNILIISGCLLGIILLGMFFKIGISKIIKLVINSILGGILIYIINRIGGTFGIHIGLNIITSIFVGMFGIPGAILLIVLKKI